ncbi:Nonribosomal peptide synthetases (NRPS) [Penicillium malachiteum]|uniref:Nonribosomal peptide synthetases (NRPS) n=1 Tax=Penicillium malachiteum TaxID=1324776 RepID=UPI0025499884|nr:Nonribosomal peptide synthetases (NRPS) [Penicillium malachiteum]KAJ5737065.1 Nonribosomal peptide synthetases (NRPS) [Penicillium malachiteum]
MFQAMLTHSKTLASPLKLQLRNGIIAGSSLAETLIRMTELSFISFLTDPSKVSLLYDRSSVGTPLFHTSAKVVDSDLKIVPAGTRGELLVSGYLLFSGYYKNQPETDKAIFRDAKGQPWLRTGDIVTLSKSGACMVVGRVKDLIKKGGESIAPTDIEKILEQHPGIAATAITGVPDARWGETIAAYIQRGEEIEMNLKTKDIKIWLRNRVTSHKIPDHVF